MESAMESGPEQIAPHPRIAPHRWIKDREGRFLRVNPALAAALEHSTDALLGRPDADFFPSGAVVRYRRDDRRAAESDRSVHFFEPSVHVPAPGWITTKTPLRHGGVRAVAGVARPWSTASIHRALEIPRPIDGNATDGSGWVLGAQRAVRARFRERLTVRELAEAVGLNPDYFGRRFGEVVGLNVHALVRKLRVAWCLERLAGANRGLSALAHRAGFADQSHMTRSFKREVGLPPGAFRETLEGAAAS